MVSLLWRILLILSQFKGKNSCINEASLAKLVMHQCVIATQIRLKFHEILFSDFLVMASDGRMDRDRWKNG